MYTVSCKASYTPKIQVVFKMFLENLAGAVPKMSRIRLLIMADKVCAMFIARLTQHLH